MRRRQPSRGSLLRQSRHSSHSTHRARIASPTTATTGCIDRPRSTVSGEGSQLRTCPWAAPAIPAIRPTTVTSMRSSPVPSRPSVPNAQPPLIAAPTPKTNPPTRARTENSHSWTDRVEPGRKTSSITKVTAMTHSTVFRKLPSMCARPVERSSATALTLHRLALCTAKPITATARRAQMATTASM